MRFNRVKTSQHRASEGAGCMRVSGHVQGSLRMRRESGCLVFSHCTKLQVALITRHLSSSAAQKSPLFFFFFFPPLVVSFSVGYNVFAFGVEFFFLC